MDGPGNYHTGCVDEVVRFNGRVAIEETSAAYAAGRGKRLVMLGYFGFGNTGDEAVLAAEVAALREELGPQTSFLVVSGDPAHTRATHRLPAIRRTDARALLAAVRSADAVIAGGGSLLQDVTSARPVAYYGGVMAIAARVGTPVFVYAQGLGPLRRGLNRRIAGCALRRATYVGLRDGGSARLARELGVGEVAEVPDAVLGMDNLRARTRRAGHDSVDALTESEADQRSPAIGATRHRTEGPAAHGQPEGREAEHKADLAVALRPWPGQEQWLPEVTAAVRELAASMRVRVVALHHGQDVELARTLASSLSSDVEVVDPATGYHAVLDAVATSRVVLGMRLHALIAAAAAERPFVALSYDPKVAAFAAQLRQPVVADLTVGDVAPARSIVQAVGHALEADDPAYAARVRLLRTAAREPARVAAQALSELSDGDHPQPGRWAGGDLV